MSKLKSDEIHMENIQNHEIVLIIATFPIKLKDHLQLKPATSS